MDLKNRNSRLRKVVRTANSAQTKSHASSRRIKKRRWKRKIYYFLLDATQNRAKRIMIYLALGILLLLILGLIMGVKSLFGSSDDGVERSQSVPKNVNSEGAAESTEEVDTETLIKQVKAQAKKDNVPEDIIGMVDKYPETVDYVADYTEKKDTKAPKDLGDSFVKGEIPQILQWDERWGYQSYGTSYIGVAGCGPTALSMVISGLTEDSTITPYTIAKFSDKNHLIDENNSSYWSLMEKAANEYGVGCEEISVSKSNFQEELQAGNPLICSVGPGDFTTKGHFIVLVADEDGKIKVNDPVSQIQSDKLWDYDRIVKQAKAAWKFYKE